MAARFSNDNSLFRRWLKFSLVGATGIAVQLLTLGVLLKFSPLHYLIATALAVETSVLHNYVWHKRWTWADRQIKRKALLRFNFTNGALSLAGNLLLMWLLVGSVGLDARLANVLTISVCALANFLLSDRFVFV